MLHTNSLRVEKLSIRTLHWKVLKWEGQASETQGKVDYPPQRCIPTHFGLSNCQLESPDLAQRQLAKCATDTQFYVHLHIYCPLESGNTKLIFFWSTGMHELYLMHILQSIEVLQCNSCMQWMCSAHCAYSIAVCSGCIVQAVLSTNDIKLGHIMKIVHTVRSAGHANQAQIPTSTWSQLR